MAGPAKKTPREKFYDELAKQYPQITVPGYWNTLVENCDQWAEEFTISPIWRKATADLTAWRQEYRDTYSADLLSNEGLPKFTSKSLPSIQDKLWRKHRANPNFVAFTQEAPVPNLGDLVRTRIVCKYIDGVEFLANKIQKLAEDQGLQAVRERQGKIEGYFAQHINFSHTVLYRSAGGGMQTQVMCEIQIATDFATKMWDASHSLYELDRNSQPDTPSWQWSPNDPRFIANQLGHMMHLADGLLVQLRDQTKDKDC